MTKEKEIELKFKYIKKFIYDNFVTDKKLTEYHGRCLQILQYELRNLEQIVMKKEETIRKNGVYKSELATYYIKDDKILMLMKGQFYKTSESFMQGVYTEELTDEQMNQFNEAYDQVSQW